jgi:predicted SnoaL-like aldol condensation-catalyzing enzyme
LHQGTKPDTGLFDTKKPTGKESPMITETLQERKAIVRDFYDLAFNQQKPEDAAARYLGPVYIQHNPNFADGREAFISAVKGFVAAYPKLHVEFKRFIAEEELVAVHSHMTLEPGDPGLALMDIFRLENDKIVEHWDVAQEVTATAANSNTMF